MSCSIWPEVLEQNVSPCWSGMSPAGLGWSDVPLTESHLCLQAWTNMVLTLLNQVLLLSEPAFLALQPVLYPCLSQLSCHVTNTQVRQALREWLGRVGRLYDIVL